MQSSFHIRAVGFTKLLKPELTKPFTSIAQNNFYSFFNNTEPFHLYSSLIRQCVDTKSTLDIVKIQTHIVKSGFVLGLGDKLVDAYVKCGSFVEARKMFDELPKRHIVTWNSMIATCISYKEIKEAIGLYKMMIWEGVFPDEFTFSSILKAFCEMGSLHEGQRAHGLSVVLGLDGSNVFVGSALVDMYSKFGRMRDAKSVADRVVERDVVLFTALIVGYSHQRADGEALGVFVRMINEGVKANEYTFASVLIACGNLEDLGTGKLLHGLIVKSGFGSAVASQTSLLTMYSKCGFINDSLTVFKEFANPNQVTWTSLIGGLVENGRIEIALTKFRQMIRNSVNPNSFTLSSVLRACASLAMLEEGKQIHSIVTKCGLDKDKYSGAALIDLYGKCGSTEMARLVFDDLIQLDVVAINSMIYSYAQNGFGHEALKLFSRMKDLGQVPNEVTYVSVLLACNNEGLVEQGCQIFASMKNNHNISLTKDHYACMVDLLGRSGRLEEAETLINQVSNPDAVLRRTLLSACRIHGAVEMVERIKNRVLELAPGDGGTHVLLSNLYASTGKWSQVIDIKTTMREMKLRKDPAMTWVDVDRKVHIFMAGDWSHPSSREIFETLEELIEKVKSLGYVPDTRFVLQDLDEEKKKRSLYYHSERLAIAFALWKTKNKSTTIRIYKNLRVVGDCHTWDKICFKSC